MDFVREPARAPALLLGGRDRPRELPAQPPDALQTRLVLGPLPLAAHEW